MKNTRWTTNLLALVLILSIAEVVEAQEPAPGPVAAPLAPEPSPGSSAAPLPGILTYPEGAPRNAGKPGIVTGAIFDVIGYGFVVAGGLVTSLNLGVGLNLLYGGAGSLTIGSVVGTASYTYRHGRYADAGFDPRGGPRAGAWVLTGLTLGCAGGSVATAVLAGSEESFGLAIASISLAGGAAIFEIINLLAVRSKSWERALLEAPKAGPGPTAYPAVFAISTPVRGELIPALGAGMAF